MLEVSNFESYGPDRKPADPREIARLPLRVDESPIRDVNVVTTPGAIARGYVRWESGSLYAGVGPRGKVRAVLMGTGYLKDADIRSDGSFELTGLYGPVRIEVAPGSMSPR